MSRISTPGVRFPRIVIVRDRPSAGGGIYSYYEAVRKHLRVEHEFVDIGRPHDCYGTDFSIWQKLGKFTPLRLVWEWLCLCLKLLKRPDLVHLNPGLDFKSMRSLKRDAVSVRLAKLAGRRVLVFWRGWDNEACGTAEFPGGNENWVARSYRAADAHIVLAEDFKNDLRRWKFDAPVRIETTVVPDSVLAAAPHERSAPGDRIQLLFLSRMEVAKGVFELVEAFAILEQRQPGRFSLVLAGDGPALEELKARVRAAGLASVSLPGYVSGESKLKCYRDASIFCFLSYTEGMPNAVLEALAMGLPLVSSLAGGLKGILKEGVTGYSVNYSGKAEPGKRFNPAEVADAVLRIADNPESYRAMSSHNKTYARERFAAVNVAGRLEEAYNEVLSM